jgi:hypothetical protein
VSTTALIDNVFFVSAGETTTREGLVRLTGSNGPGTVSTTPASTVTVRETETVAAAAAANPAVIAGSVVGGAVAGALVTLLVVVLLWFGKQKKARAQGPRQDGNAAAVFVPAGQAPGAISAGVPSPYVTGWAWDANGQHELHRFSGPAGGQGTPELGGKPR